MDHGLAGNEFVGDSRTTEPTISHLRSTPAATLESLSLSDFSQFALGVTIECRDEHWLVSNVTRTTDGYLSLIHI